MAVVIMDGKTRVSWLVAVANTAAPTVAEMAGGVSLETAFTPDGLDIKVTTGRKDTSNLASRRNSERVTRISYAVAGTFYRDDTNDIAWNLLPYGAKGFLVVREGIDRETPWASGQRVRVFPLEAGEPNPVKQTPEERWTFDTEFAVWAGELVNQRAVIA
ncbi:hypothetical protein Lfu02_79790 [Longispora fulva]|uniref:Uncharacterized protein n=1 Tax=Longispora fulva TaxID=619741 RepID=A0A8J7GI87_9ACTN|nr:hypothetical protein [Longispora fulva]MBG6141138.1 hypothetical protein [Longispora fulva]GIG63607.1 hypothetical protein Lfu02_79790 [Longispora fulva]